MQTAVLRVEKRSSGDAGYPVSLRVWDGDGPLSGTVDADDLQVHATGTIAAGLCTPEPPVPTAGSTGPAQAIRQLLVGKEGPSKDVVQALGTWLHAMLDEAGVGAALRGLRAEMPPDLDPGQGQRLLLDLRPPEIGHLPWELLFDAEAGRWPFGELPNPAARITEQYGAKDIRRDWWWPLKFLVITGSPGDEIETEEELDRLEDALAPLCAEVDLEVLEQPTRDRLLEELRRRPPHVLHFIGHGDCADGHGRLVFDLKPEDQPPARWFWREGEIGADLERAPRMVVLNCCRTDAGDDQEGAWQVADAFARRGVPAVVSMQGPISGPDAVAFSTAFYTSLAAGATFDVAFTRGRRAITAKDDGWRRREMCFPTLTLSQPSHLVLPPRWIPGPQIRHRVEELEADVVPKLLDRRPFRRKLLEQLDADGEFASPPRLIWLTGQEEIGKTALAKWAIARQAQRGRKAVYVDLGEEDGCGWLELLRRTRDAVQAAVDDRAPFDRFTRDLNYLVQRQQPPGEDPPGPVEDALGRFDGTADDLAEIFASFLRALRDTAADEPLIIAIDPLRVVSDDDMTKYLEPKLIGRVAAHDAPDTRLLLVRRASAGERLYTGPATYRLHVEGFETGERAIKSLARQYLLLTLEDPESVEAKMPYVPPAVRTGAPNELLGLFGYIARVAA